MTKLDKDRAIDEIERFLHVTDQIVPDMHGSAIAYFGTVQRGSETDAASLAHVVEQIIDRTLPEWRNEPRSSNRKDKSWEHLRESAARAKVGRRDITETDLFNQAFSLDKPTIGAPQLRLMADDGSKTYQNVHRGARSLTEGLYAGVRNPASHQILGHVDEQHALEQLAAFSLLAHWVDAATVESAR